MHEPPQNQHLIAAALGLQAAGALQVAQRIQIAAAVQAAFLSNYFAGRQTEDLADRTFAGMLAEAAVVHADALLEALRKERTNPRPF